MWKNYLKMSWKVLFRSPFYTIISLTGISLTLMILMVAVSFFEHSLAPTGILKNFERVVTIQQVVLKNTTKNNMSSSSLTSYFIDEYVKKIKRAESICMSTWAEPYLIYNEGKKYDLFVRFCDANFWRILSFEFLKGRAFNAQEEKNAEPLAVIDDKTAIEYFGTLNIVGKMLQIDHINYKICGVVKNVPSVQKQGFAQVFIPASLCKYNIKTTDLLGSFDCYILAKKTSDIEKIKQEWKQILPKVVLPEGVNKIEADIKTPVEVFFNDLWFQIIFSTYNDNVLLIIFSIMIALILSLPTLNLINLNVTRVLERSSEIGVRKSFGASSKNLILQFITEYIFLTLIGGIIGFVLSFIVLKIISSDTTLINYDFSINYRIFFIGLGITILFGLLSGIYPAWKMSKLNIMNALKEEKI